MRIVVYGAGRSPLTQISYYIGFLMKKLLYISLLRLERMFASNSYDEFHPAPVIQGQLLCSAWLFMAPPTVFSNLGP